LAELERLDQQEYNLVQPPTLAEKVLRDKRRKLTETWSRVMSLYRKEDSDRFLELNRMERDYEAKRDQMAKLFHAVKSAEEVVLDEIPLPMGPVDEQLNLDESQSEYRLEPGTFGKRVQKIDRKPPGCPPGIPPKITDLEAELADFGLESAPAKAPVDEDLNQFLKEIEQVEKADAAVESKKASIVPIVTPKTTAPAVPTALFSTLPTVNPTPPMMPPISGMSSAHSPVVPPLTFGSSMPPPIRPPGFLPHIHTSLPTIPGMANSLPPINRHPYSAVPMPKMVCKTFKPDCKPESVGQATIEAKPQLRNLSADATRFLPVSLRVKRNETKPRNVPKFEGNFPVFFNQSNYKAKNNYFIIFYF
jgi:WW domain-binding protein 11